MDNRSQILPFFAPGWTSILRIGCWCIFFLWLSGRFMPHMAEQIPIDPGKSGSVVPMLTIFDDHRTVREDYRPDPKKIHIAWISDSSGTIFPSNGGLDPQNYRTLPADVADLLRKRRDMPAFDMPLYLRLGSGPVDMLLFTLRALQDKPDIIVISVNDIYSFSHFGTMNMDTSLSLIPSVWARYPELWDMIPVLCSPIDLLWAAGGMHLDIIRYASPFKNFLEQKYSMGWLGSAGQPSPITFDWPLRNIKFWTVMNVLHGDYSKLLDQRGKMSAKLVYLNLVAQNNPENRDSLALFSFWAMLKVLKQSGIPAIIYEHPLSDYLHGARQTQQSLAKIGQFLTNTSQGLKGSRIRILRIPEALRKSIPFRAEDGYHIDARPVKFEEYLAGQVWVTLKDNDKLTKQSGNAAP